MLEPSYRLATRIWISVENIVFREDFILMLISMIYAYLRDLYIHVLSFDIKECIWHFVKWHIHPFISKGTHVCFSDGGEVREDGPIMGGPNNTQWCEKIRVFSKNYNCPRPHLVVGIPVCIL